MPRFAMLGLLVLYVPLVMWVQHGVAHPDYEAVRPFEIVFRALRLDTEAYLAKAFLLIDPAAPRDYWLLERVGELATVAILGAIVAALVLGSGDRRLTWIGLVGFAIVIAPPLITRAAISLLNTPTHRQLYLPLLFGLPPVLAAVLIRARKRGWVFALVGLFAAAGAVQSNCIASQFPLYQRVGRITHATRTALADQDPRKTLVVVGLLPCHFYPKVVWPGEVVRAFPEPRRAGDVVILTAIDDHTLEGRAASGFGPIVLDVPGSFPDPPGRYNQGRNRMPRVPAFTRERTMLAVHGATIELVERTDDAPTVLRAHLERGLGESIVLVTKGCESAEVVQIAPAR
jgi:hypothetical protein